ncbi:hypothetical protein PC9H_009012 [Pleurotus ostreatus]|uniref:Zn(2)-C6 fungal-type domain-containing protein n=1 Tax=Pleurotus ostreatus TaxID=5322 RepID=A0A8H6ZQ32_PLEOS|nr:uncharacterized protein PC9H_009012 [Pleurotus ostreatus]KAF7426643.1 hypothetical protein PC9H_009012 [Pleurotus ostreatus]
MNRLNYDYLSSTHGTQQVPRALATQSPSEVFPMSVYSGQNMMLEDDTESTGAFAETVREIEEEFYRTFPAARLPPMVPLSCEWFYDRTTGQYLPRVAREIKDSDYPPCFSEDDSTVLVLSHTQRETNDSSLTKATYSYDTQPNRGAPVHESICASPAVAAVPPHLVVDSPMTPVYTEHGIAMKVAGGHWKYHRYETCVDSSTPSDHGEAHPEWSQYEHGSGSPSRSRRSPSPRLETYPASSYSLEPEMSPAPLSPLLDEKPPEKKPPLACLFCRGRKIACGPPLPGSKDRTCNQCQRRSLQCEYPLESRRGMRKKKVPVATEPPKEAVPDSKSNPVPSVLGPPAPIDQKPTLNDVSHRPSEPDVSQQKHPGTHPSSSDGVPIETE